MKLIHQLSKETGIPIATIRFYERLGLIAGKKKQEIKSNNYSYYDEEVLYKLVLIRDAKSVGFTLIEIKELIEVWYNKKISKDKKIEILDNKLIQIEEKIKELELVKQQIISFKVDVEKNDC